MEGKPTGEERKVGEEEETGNKQERRGAPEDSTIGPWEQTRPEADSVPFCRESSALTLGTVSGDTEASGKTIHDSQAWTVIPPVPWNGALPPLPLSAPKAGATQDRHRPGQRCCAASAARSRDAPFWT